jgi:hypothetical protein
MKSIRLETAASLAFFLAIAAHFAVAQEGPEFRPALVGDGPNSLVNLINEQKLLQQGQPDGAVMFERGIFPPGKGKDFAEVSRGTAGSNLLQKEVLRALNRSRFVPAIAHHHPVPVNFRGAVLFFAHSEPHLRVLANQNPDALAHFEDFIAPQEILGTAHEADNDPRIDSLARKDKTGAATLELRVNEKGKLVSSRVLSEEPPGYRVGAYEADALATAEFVPGFRKGKPCACSFQLSYSIVGGPPGGYGSR